MGTFLLCLDIGEIELAKGGGLVYACIDPGAQRESGAIATCIARGSAVTGGGEKIWRRRKDMLAKRVVPGATLVAVYALLLMLSGVSSRLKADPNLHHLLFQEADKLILFSGPDVNGVITGLQAGTAEGGIHGDGSIRGTVLINFRFFLTGPTTFNFDVRTGITDTDGDQLIYRATGTGRFICPPLADPSPPLPGPPQGINGLGGPLSGTATIVAASAQTAACPNCGKFVSLVGQPLVWRGIGYNPGNGCDPAQQFGLGGMFVQVFGPNVHHP